MLKFLACASALAIAAPAIAQDGPNTPMADPVVESETAVDASVDAPMEDAVGVDAQTEVETGMPDPAASVDADTQVTTDSGDTTMEAEIEADTEGPEFVEDEPQGSADGIGGPLEEADPLPEPMAAEPMAATPTTPATPAEPMTPNANASTAADAATAGMPTPDANASATAEAATNDPAAVEAYVSSEFATYDSDGNGELSQNEFASWILPIFTEQLQEAMTQTEIDAWAEAAFAQTDADQSNGISSAELTAFLTA